LLKNIFPHSLSKGFTILELMAVLAIIGLLMTVAVPSVQRYIQRAQFTSVIQATGPYKTAVGLCALQNDLSACGEAGKNGIPEAFQASDTNKGYVAAVTVEPNGVITASSRIKIGETAVVYKLIPVIDTEGTLTWQVDGTAQNSCVRHRLC
jgi:type IV pilus assembly protein PilA